MAFLRALHLDHADVIFWLIAGVFIGAMLSGGRDRIVGSIYYAGQVIGYYTRKTFIVVGMIAIAVVGIAVANGWRP